METLKNIFNKLLHHAGLIFALVACLFSAVAQTTPHQAIAIGSQVPDFTIPTIIGYNRTSAKLSDFRGKLLILDFWSIWCGGCIDEMPKLEKLQKQFGEKIMVLPVAFTRPKGDLEAFFQKRAKAKIPVNLPSAVYTDMNNDMIGMFPCAAFPMKVIIDPMGKLLAITDSYYITPENIAKTLAGDTVDYPLAFAYTGPRPKKAGQIKAFMDSGHVLFQSRLIGFQDTVRQQRFFSLKQTGDYTRLYIANAPVVDLFKASIYGNNVRGEHSDNRLLVVEIPDSASLFLPQRDTNYDRNLRRFTYTYESLLPPGTSEAEGIKVMNQEISAFFGISATLEKRLVSCWILRQVKPTFDLKSKGASTLYKNDKSIDSLRIFNHSIRSLIGFLSVTEAPLIVDETLYSSVDIALRVPKEDKTNLDALNAILKKYNLTLEPGKRERQVLVLRKKLPG